MEGPEIFSRGSHTLQVPLALHVENREKFVTALKFDEGTVVVFRGGMERCRDDSDHEEVHRQESYFHYLFGVKEPDWYGAVDSLGNAMLFAPVLPESSAVWMGEIATLEVWSERYGVPTYWIDDMEKVFKKKYTQILTLQGVNSDSKVDIATVLPIKIKATPSREAYQILAECRVCKSAKEIDVMRYAGIAASIAHVKVMKTTKQGDMEYQIEARFLSSIYEDHGCRHAAYTSICASGPNAAVLHYGHAGAPNDRELRAGDMILLDMGAEYHCYCSDITCTFPVNGIFTDDQKLVYNAVLEAQRAVMTNAKPGVSWVALHDLAERTIITNLIDGNVLTGDLDAMLKANLGGVFMPHGLGHLLGIDTHDVGGYLDGCPTRPTLPGKRSLRTARVLQEGMTITVEPGCYFIDALLDPALQDPSTSGFFNVDVLNRFRRTGGVRIEDNVIITDDGVLSMTLCPRTVDEVEAVMRGDVWPPPVDTAPELCRDWGTVVDGRFVRGLDTCSAHPWSSPSS